MYFSDSNYIEPVCIIPSTNTKGLVDIENNSNNGHDSSIVHKSNQKEYKNNST